MFFRVVGNLFVAAGLVGLAYLAVTTGGVVYPPKEGAVATPQLALVAVETPSDEAAVEMPDVQAGSTEPLELITHVRIPRLQIDSEVVPSPFVQVADTGTWAVPAFKVGHAEYTAGAGQVGNAVLFGHVTSRSLGNVFQTLERARRGDTVEISNGTTDFTYAVVDVRRVPRTDVTVVEPTDTASASLITCTGLWLPYLNDYAERVVVRADLVGSRPG